MGLKLRTVHGDSTVHAVVVRIKQPPRNPQLHIFIRDRTTALWVLIWPIFFAHLWCPMNFYFFFWSVLPSFAFLACLPLSFFSVFYLIEFCKYIHCALAAITTTLTQLFPLYVKRFYSFQSFCILLFDQNNLSRQVVLYEALFDSLFITICCCNKQPKTGTRKVTQ